MKTRYGQRGGDGPNTGTIAMFFEAVYQGQVLKRRFFNLSTTDIAEGQTVVAAIMLQTGKPYLWVVALDEKSFPDYVHHALSRNDGSVVIAAAKRVA